MFLQTGWGICFFLPPSHPLCRGNKRGTCWLSEPLRAECESRQAFSSTVSHRYMMNCSHLWPLPSPSLSSLPRNTSSRAGLFVLSYLCFWSNFREILLSRNSAVTFKYVISWIFLSFREYLKCDGTLLSSAPVSLILRKKGLEKNILCVLQ